MVTEWVGCWDAFQICGSHAKTERSAQNSAFFHLGCGIRILRISFNKHLLVKKVMVNPSAATPWSLCLVKVQHVCFPLKNATISYNIHNIYGCLGKHVAMWLSGSWVSSSMILTSSMELFEHILWAAQLELRHWAHPFGATRHQANSGCTDLNSTCGSKIHNRETRETGDPH